MITKFSYWLARRLAEKAERDDEDYIRYGIEVVLSTLSKITIFLIISLVFNVFLEMFSIILSFVALRVITGGVHMSTYSRCLTTSLLMFVLPTFLFRQIAVDHSSIYFTSVVFLLAVIFVFIYVPVSAANRPIPQEKHQFFKWTSLIFLISWFVLMTSLFYYSFPRYGYIAFYSTVGILLQTFTLTPFGYALLENIDRYLSKKERQLGGVKNEKGI